MAQMNHELEEEMCWSSGFVSFGHL